MTERTPVVTSFLRNNAEILLLKRATTNPTYPGEWAAVSGYLENEDPLETAQQEITQETGITTFELVRSGSPLPVDDRGDYWLVHPFLFETPTRAVALNKEHDEYEWTPPTAILRRPTVPAFWETYERIAPTAETIATDHDHGSAYLSIRALEVLRDAAGKTAVRNGEIDILRETARRLLAARPSMAACRNRVNRVMASADTPDTIEQTAITALHAALTADATAGTNATRLVTDRTILTLSRSGTVQTALREAEPRLIVAESRPANEGTHVAETLADAGLGVTVCTDAAIAHTLSSLPVDAVLVGADTILPDGTVINKTGTRAAAVAAQYEAIPVYVVTATDKITPNHDPQLEAGDPTLVYDGPAPVTALNPHFDLTPPDLVDTVVTETGLHDPTDVESIAADHAANADW